MQTTLWFLLETVGSLLATACILRAYMTWLGVVARDPIGQFVIAVTDWLVKPLRRLVPARRGVDWASVLAAFVIALLLGILYFLVLAHARAPSFGLVTLLAVFWLLKWSLYLLTGVVLLQAILSWVNPHAPIAPVLNELTRPFLGPLRRIIPLVGGVDLSPLVLIIATQLLLTFIQSALPSLFSLAS